MIPAVTSLPHFLARLLSAPFRWLFGIFFSNVHGDARWMNRRERQRFLHPQKNTGIVLSPNCRLSQADSFKNLALAAPTGAGKTSQYVIPNVLLVEGSVVVTDPAGEIFMSTSGHLSERGFRIQVLQPADLQHSLRFNPLHYWKQSPQQLRQLATILAHNQAGMRSDPFWTTSATNVLYLALSALVNVEDSSYVNLANLRWLLNHLGGQGNTSTHTFMSRYLDSQVFAEYVAFCSNDPKVLASILASARAAVELWSDPDVCRFTASNSVDLRSLRKRHTALYLIVPEHQVRYFGLLLNLFYSSCFSHCLRDAENDALPVYFFLDEFGNLGKIANFGSIITTLRKRRCSISIILQDPSQLDSHYGRAEARTIFSGGCFSKLFFSGLDLETTQYIERVLGQNTEYDTTFGGIDDRARTIAVPLMSADQVRMLKDSEAILISGRQRPAKIKMQPYFRHSLLRTLAKKSPAPLYDSQPDESVCYLPFDQDE